MWTVEPLVLSVEERDELERRVRGVTTAHRDRQRAEVVLLAADGWRGTQIAPRVGMSQQSVCKWRQQFRCGGLDGLADAPRSGRPLVYGPTDRLVLMAKVTEEHPEVHASWLNQVEAFFSILTRKVLRRGEFDSRDDLVARMLSFIEHRNQTAQPFNWVYDAKKAA
jgi:transposase-like protein